MRLLLCLWVFSSGLLAAEPVRPSDFAKDYTVSNVKISPDGEHLAVRGIFAGERQLAMLNSQTMEKVGYLKFPEPHQVGEFFWVNNERLLIKVLATSVAQEEPLYYGELYGINVDGSKGDLLYGYRLKGGAGSLKLTVKRKTRGWADLVHILPDDDKHVLISSEPYSDDGSRFATVHKLNVYSGKTSGNLARSPVPGATFFSDSTGAVRFVQGTSESNVSEFYQWHDAEEDWQLMPQFSGDNAFFPLAFAGDDQRFFYLSEGDRSSQGIYQWDTKTQTSAHLFTDKDVDITQVMFAKDMSSVYALRVDVSYPEYIIFDSEAQDAAMFRALLGAFQGQNVSVTSRTRDSKLWVLRVSSDVSPGSFYLFDKSKKSLKKVFSMFDAVPADVMSPMEYITFNASDGQKIHGYLTIPAKSDKPAPLVTLVHGGPHGVRDYWGFDREVQMLANQGYAVLQLNYRGSGGYGTAFQESGYKEWGRRVQQDIIEGTQWALAQPEIDNDRVCIMGASFGGYSAAQAATLAPDLFDCVIATSGVFDLNMMFEEGDIPDQYFGEEFLKMVLGLDKSLLDSFSPAKRAALIKAPVLIAHGEKDRRVPFEQAEAFKAALTQSGKEFQWFVRATETHGFYGEDNRGMYFEKVASFLEQHLK
ncbi:alpha/beta hydrolase family protein [Planctobacterium marinum]|uniref:alpha/beta hydrolase family protein n=1 Tax=Planctobacterium marinum TaxID=1631968 RepID=UPI001E5FE60B|nr:S9 family peptidase [Planctobacterium marinum]MCC2608099.1 S9 family peptidase [Planctobacterium marinum]